MGNSKSCWRRWLFSHTPTAPASPLSLSSHSSRSLCRLETAPFPPGCPFFWKPVNRAFCPAGRRVQDPATQPSRREERQARFGSTWHRPNLKGRRVGPLTLAYLHPGPGGGIWYRITSGTRKSRTAQAWPSPDSLELGPESRTCSRGWRMGREVGEEVG